MRKDRRRLVCLDAELDDRLTDAAERRGLAVSTMIRFAVLDFLERTPAATR